MPVSKLNLTIIVVQAVPESCQCSASLLVLGIVSFLILAILMTIKCYYCDFICISLMMWLGTFLICCWLFQVKCLSLVLCLKCLLIGLSVSWLIDLQDFLYTVYEIYKFCQIMYVRNIFHNSPFHSYNFLFDKQKFLILIFTMYNISVMNIAFSVSFKKYFPTSKTQRYSLMFSSRIFIAFPFKLTSSSYLELFFVYGVG